MASAYPTAPLHLATLQGITWMTGGSASNAALKAASFGQRVLSAAWWKLSQGATPMRMPSASMGWSAIRNRYPNHFLELVVTFDDTFGASRLYRALGHGT